MGVIFESENDADGSSDKKKKGKKRGSVNLFYLIENSIEKESKILSEWLFRHSPRPWNVGITIPTIFYFLFQYYSLLNKIGSHSPFFFFFLFSYHY
jgi:hypothetical protein